MLTLNDKPFVTLDPYIDLEGFLKLEDEFNFMFCSNLDKIRNGIWSAGGHSPDFPYSIFHERDLLYYVNQRALADRKSDPELDAKIKYFEDRNDRAGLSRFYKLKYGAMDPYSILNLRTTTKNVYASDAHFTDEDWELYKWTDLIDSFPKIKEWIDQLPLEKLGIITIFYNEHYVPLGYHRDTNYFPLEKGNNSESFSHRQEFIWLRFDLGRKFCLFDINDAGQLANTVHVQGHSAFFNHHNWHGNFEPMDHSSLTVKIEGRFSADLRRNLGIDNLEYY